MLQPKPEPIAEGEESVWNYPRPPILEPVQVPIQITHNGHVIASTTRGYRVLETSHPPVYYFPPEDVCQVFLFDAPGSSFCEWKGTARYHSIRVGEELMDRVGWSYPNPTPPFQAIKNFIAFYAAPFDSCTVGGVRAVPQPGGFYGGWITPNIKGPFKGDPHTFGW